jgi:hypothetical protein
MEGSGSNSMLAAVALADISLSLTGKEDRAQKPISIIAEA